MVLFNNSSPLKLQLFFTKLNQSFHLVQKPIQLRTYLVGICTKLLRICRYLYTKLHFHGSSKEILTYLNEICHCAGVQTYRLFLSAGHRPRCSVVLLSRPDRHLAWSCANYSVERAPVFRLLWSRNHTIIRTMRTYRCVTNFTEQSLTCGAQMMKKCSSSYKVHKFYYLTNKIML